MVGQIQSVERAAAIIRFLATEREPTGLAQLSAGVGLAKATTHGLVRTLVGVGFVDQDGRTGLYSLVSDALAPDSVHLDVNEIRSRAMNWTDALAAHSGHAVQVAAFRGGELVIVHHVFGPGPGLRSMVTGAVLPLHATALGKVISAHDTRAARSLGQRDLTGYCFHTVTDPGALARELAQVRDVGWAAEVEELELGRAAIAAPVRDDSAAVVAAIGIHGPVDSLCDVRGKPKAALTDRVVKTARAVSRELGHGRLR